MIVHMVASHAIMRMSSAPETTSKSHQIKHALTTRQNTLRRSWCLPQSFYTFIVASSLHRKHHALTKWSRRRNFESWHCQLLVRGWLVGCRQATLLPAWLLARCPRLANHLPVLARPEVGPRTGSRPWVRERRHANLCARSKESTTASILRVHSGVHSRKCHRTAPCDNSILFYRQLPC